MTTDGISSEHWRRVHQLSAAVVNSCDSDILYAEALARLFSYLDQLEQTCGRRPSILATRADFLDDHSIAIPLIEEAHALATPDDHLNRLLAASSLAQIYVESAGNLDAAKPWLDKMADALSFHWDDHEHQEYLRLSELCHGT